MRMPLFLAMLLLVLMNSAKAELKNFILGESTDEQDLLFSELPSVLSASRHEQPVAKAPAAVDVITADQIKRYGWRTIAAILGSLPGFLSTYDRAYNHVGVRGFAPPGDYNTRILVLIDGHRVNESLQDYAGLGRDFLVDIENIERVEVVRGPASALYGSNALFAVVNVITQRGRDVQGVRLAGELAYYDAYQGQASLGKKFSNGTEALFSASHYHSDGHEQLHFPGLGNAYNLDTEEVERFTGKFSWQDFTLSGSWLNRQKFLPTGTTGTTFGEPGTYYHDRRAYADLNYHHLYAGDWDVTGRLFWDGYEFDDDLPYRVSNSQRIVNRDYWEGQWFGTELLVSHTFFDTHKITVGSELRYNYQQVMTNSDENPYTLYADNHKSSSVVGVYLQDEWTLLTNLSLQAGGRWDHYDSFGDTFNPRLGLIYQPTSNTTLKLLYGRAFRSPNAFESSYTCCQSSVPWIGNANLQPEKIETFEVVWEQRLGKYFDVRFSPYFNRLTDLIGLTISNTGIRQFENQGNTEAHGVESLLTGHYHNLEARLSHTYQQSQIGGQTAPNAPLHMVKLNLSAPIWRNLVFASIEMHYVSSRTTVQKANTNDYTLANLILFSKHWLPGLELTGGLYNVFDEVYIDPASPPILPDVVPQDGRNLRIRFSYEF